MLNWSDLLEYSLDTSSNADAIATCLTKKFQELAIEAGNLKAFVSDGASNLTSTKGGVAAKCRKGFASKVIYIHCICHWVALACTDRGHDYKFNNSFEENLIGLWKFSINSLKQLKS